MRTRVKICGLTRAQDAQAAVDAGADAIGLVFYSPSPRAVSVEQACAVIADLPAFVTITALFVDPAPELVKQVLAKVRPDLLQFHGDEAESFCMSFGRSYIKAVRMQPETQLSSMFQRYATARSLLLDAYRAGVPGGTGESFDWNLIPEHLASRIVLAGGLGPANVGAAVRQLRPYAVDVSGGVESAKGIKDPLLIQQFIDEVRCADNCRSE